MTIGLLYEILPDVKKWINFFTDYGNLQDTNVNVPISTCTIAPVIWHQRALARRETAMSNEPMLTTETVKPASLNSRCKPQIHLDFILQLRHANAPLLSCPIWMYIGISKELVDIASIMHPICPIRSHFVTTAKAHGQKMRDRLPTSPSANSHLHGM